MKFIDDIKTLFKSKTVTTSVETDFSGPLRLRKDAFVEFDTIAFNMLSEDTNFGEAPTNQKIASIGKVDLGQGVFLNRYYFDDDETWMQINMQGEGNDGIEEMIVWKYHHTETPTSGTEITKCLKSMGGETIELNGKTYERVWGTGDKAELVEFNEDVYLDKDSIKEYTVRHKCMLYRRALENSARIEFYLVSAENGGDGTLIVHSIGLSISPEDIKNF
jgi:hypothetical protein